VTSTSRLNAVNSANGAPRQDLLLVGLGNPGSQYAGTRHNLGWDCLEALARRREIQLSRRRWHSRVGWFETDKGRLWLQEPQTFMNLSGKAVGEAVRDLKLELGAVWVVHDELDLPLGRLRIRRGGSAAGHNGIRSLIERLGPEFVRFRVGVGKPPRSGPDGGRDYVLSRFSEPERNLIGQVVAGVVGALEMALESGLDQAMSVYNRSGSLGCEELA
jgi:peptidyl-tRNA hydrolase, PTH1 family